MEKTMGIYIDIWTYKSISIGLCTWNIINLTVVSFQRIQNLKIVVKMFNILRLDYKFAYDATV